MAEQLASSSAFPRSATAAQIANFDALVDHGLGELRAAALGVAAAGLAACDPEQATRRVVRLEGERLVVDGVDYELAPDSRIVVLGAGKASLPIARALEGILGDRLTAGIVLVPGRRAAAALERIEVVSADHPLPTRRSAAAARKVLALAEREGPHDLVLACFTGGSSSLMSLPPEGVTLAEKRALHRVLLSAGMPITEVNAVRKHVSRLKGGRLAAAVAPARIVNLTVSDVAGNHIDAITDPTVQDTSTPADAIAILRAHGLWSVVAPSVRRHLELDAAASPRLDGMEIQTVLLATGMTACDAMILEASTRGFPPVVVSHSLEGESREVGGLLLNLARQSYELGSPFAAPSMLVGCGGESTVSLAPRGRFGQGGPNQEAALAAALQLRPEHRIAAVFLDSDGSDGGTEVAGGLVDGQTALAACDRGVDLRGALIDHRSTEALRALGDAVVTGATGTNVNDLFAVAIGPREEAA